MTLSTLNTKGRGAGVSRKENWADRVDWSQSDIEIAESVGVSRQRVHQVRTRRGEPPPASTTARQTERRKHEETLKTWLEAHNPRDYSQTEVMKLSGVPKWFLSEKKLEYRRGWANTKYDWDSISLEDWAELNDSEIARRLGNPNPGGVRAYRLRHDLPGNPEGGRRLLAWDRITRLEWLTLSNEEVAGLLGTTRATVANYRSRNDLPRSPRTRGKDRKPRKGRKNADST